MYYIKLGLITGTFCQILLRDTLRVPHMLQDNLRLYQSKLKVISPKKLTLFQSKYRGYIYLEATNFLFINIYETPVIE